MEMRALKCGKLVWVGEKGKAEKAVCNWLVQRPTNNPEPDFPEDCYRVEDCGARLSIHPTYGMDGFVCDAGHERVPIEASWAPGGQAYVEEMLERSFGHLTEVAW
jgi:hypothetical protein